MKTPSRLLRSACAVRAADVYKEPHVRYLIADMTLNTDPHYSDDWRRYFIAEIQLAGTKEKIAGFGHRFHDYNCLVAVAHYDAGHRVANLDRFEFNAVEGKPGVSNVVYRGTGCRAAPADIRLTSDSARRAPGRRMARGFPSVAPTSATGATRNGC